MGKWSAREAEALATIGLLAALSDGRKDASELERLSSVFADFGVVGKDSVHARVALGNATLEEAIEQIDIGGPSLIRAAAKNHAFITVATDPVQYGEILEQVARDRATTPELRRRLAQAPRLEARARHGLPQRRLDGRDHPGLHRGRPAGGEEGGLSGARSGARRGVHAPGRAARRSA